MFELAGLVVPQNIPLDVVYPPLLILKYASLSSTDNRRLLYVGSSRAKNLLNIAMLDDIEREEMGDLLKSIAPDRHVPKNKKGLKRLLNITIQ